MNRTLGRKLPGVDDVAFTMGHWHAALYVKAAVRGMLTRAAVKEAWGLAAADDGGERPLGITRTFSRMSSMRHAAAPPPEGELPERPRRHPGPANGVHAAAVADRRPSDNLLRPRPTRDSSIVRKPTPPIGRDDTTPLEGVSMAPVLEVGEQGHENGDQAEASPAKRPVSRTDDLLLQSPVSEEDPPGPVEK